MIKSFLFYFTLLTLSSGCSQTPTSNNTVATPVQRETPITSPAPVASATPAVSTPTDAKGIKNLLQMIDDQVSKNVLQAKEVKNEALTLRYWSGAQGVRRIDQEDGGGVHRFYFADGRLFALNAEGKWPPAQGQEAITTVKWAGIAPDGTLVGPPFQFIAGKASPFADDAVRILEKRGTELLSQAP